MSYCKMTFQRVTSQGPEHRLAARLLLRPAGSHPAATVQVLTSSPSLCYMAQVSPLSPQLACSVLPFQNPFFPLNSLPANIYQNSCLLRQLSKMPEHETKEIYLGKGVLEVSHSSTLQWLLPPANLRMAWFEYVNVMR